MFAGSEGVFSVVLKVGKTNKEEKKTKGWFLSVTLDKELKIVATCIRLFHFDLY